MKILFWGLNYHTYTVSIIEELKSKGHSVDYVDIYPRSIFFKFFRTVFPAGYQRYINQYHEQAIQKYADVDYDRVIFLQAHQIQLTHLQKIRQIHTNAEFVLYNWDSISNHDYRKHAPHFDRVITFDKNDAIEMGYEYLPLFCTRDLQDVAMNSAKRNKIFMVGNIVKPARYLAVKEFRKYCKDKQLHFVTYLKITPVVLLQLWREGIIVRDFKLKSIQPATYKKIIENSYAVFDFANHTQSGQTMRIIESLCTGKKIITNNVWIKQEPFFSPDRILIIEGYQFDEVLSFLNIPLTDPTKRFEQYHIQNFVLKLLNK